MAKIKRSDKPVVLPLCYGCQHHSDDCQCTCPNKMRMIATIDAELFSTSRNLPGIPDCSRIGACTEFSEI